MMSGNGGVSDRDNATIRIRVAIVCVEMSNIRSTVRIKTGNYFRNEGGLGGNLG